MSRLITLLLAVTLGLFLAGTQASAQDIRIEPIPAKTKPKWTPVPNAPGVYWAPNIPTDVFRHGSRYYFFWAGYLYHSNKARGPWKVVEKVPDWFSQIDPSYFKTFKPGEPAAPSTGPPGAPEGLGPAPPEGAPPAPPAPAPAPEKKPEAPATPPKAM